MTAPPDSLNDPSRPRSELGLRTASGLVLAIVVLGATFLGGWPFTLLWLAASVAVAIEWMNVAKVGRPATVALAGAGLAFLSLATAAADGPLVGGVAAGVVLALLVVLSGAGSRAWIAGGFLYAALVAIVPISARGIPGIGLALVLWMFAVVWTTDVAAYFVGRGIGGPKLWRRISPKKTWSGFLGGVAAASFAGYAVASVAAGRGVPVPVSGPVVAAASAVAAAASQAGDLAESAMKRHFGVKDSGWLIPGHGGVMDRLDGFIAVLLLAGLALAGAKLAAG